MVSLDDLSMTAPASSLSTDQGPLTLSPLELPCLQGPPLSIHAGLRQDPDWFLPWPYPYPYPHQVFGIAFLAH